jgi:hypothetical protein
MNYRDNHTPPTMWRSEPLTFKSEHLSDATLAIASMRNTQFRDDSTRFGDSVDYVDASEVDSDWLKVGGTS